MLPYQLIRPLLFSLSPECAHSVAMKSLTLANKLGLAKLAGCSDSARLRKPKQLLGMEFANPVGLAAGFDKNGDYIDALGQLGFGFIEIGTITPRPQPGNPQPRLFRLPKAEALINRMGFNNLGVDHLVQRVRAKKYAGVLGINLGKNFDTPLEKAHEDYVASMRRVYTYASFLTVNISSPNTSGLRDLQQAKELTQLLDILMAERNYLARDHGKTVPLLVKVAPDMGEEQIADMCEVFKAKQIDGVIATNTTLSRTAVAGLPHAEEKGGLSGKPLTKMSTEVIRLFRKHLGPDMPIIGVGGIFSGADAVEKLDAGADLVQLYTGFIYKGPALVEEIIQTIG